MSFDISKKTSVAPSEENSELAAALSKRRGGPTTNLPNTSNATSKIVNAPVRLVQTPVTTPTPVQTPMQIPVTPTPSIRGKVVVPPVRILPNNQGPMNGVKVFVHPERGKIVLPPARTLSNQGTRTKVVQKPPEPYIQSLANKSKSTGDLDHQKAQALDDIDLSELDSVTEMLEKELADLALTRSMSDPLLPSHDFLPPPSQYLPPPVEPPPSDYNFVDYPEFPEEEPPIDYNSLELEQQTYPEEESYSMEELIDIFQQEFDVRNLILNGDPHSKFRAANLLINIFKGVERDKELQKRLKLLPGDTLVNLLGCLAICISDMA